MMKLNNKQAATYIGLIIMIMGVFCIMKGFKKRSTYQLSPEPIKIESKDGSIFSLPYDIKCVPGPSASSAYYTKDLTPGGICGDQEFVRSQAEDYKIVDGIGGSLLDQ